MSWVLDGKRVVGNYLGQEANRVTGVVTESRVGYGGTIKHYVQLDAPITVFWMPRERVVLDACHIVEVEGE